MPSLWLFYGKNFHWNGQQSRLWNSKHCRKPYALPLFSAPSIQDYLPSSPRILPRSASGAVMEHLEEKRTHPASFVPYNLTEPEQNYTGQERELPAIVYKLLAWRPYLHGKSFVVYSDHYRFRYLETQLHLSCKQPRWLETLVRLEFWTAPISEK